MVTYKPRKSGNFTIQLSCGNIPLNDGNLFRMKVLPGMVNASLSVLQYASSVERYVKNEVLVQLMDSYMNLVSSHQEKLMLEIIAKNGSSFVKWPFMENQDASYSGYYIARDIDAFSICVSFADIHLSHCPYEVHVHESNYFPKAKNDTISVWEGESVSFDVLSNDNIAGGKVNLAASSLALYGSLLQYEKLFRYTPYIGFFGNDSFSYTISDVNNNSASGTVFISVLLRPPQFVSLPTRLYSSEDTLSPMYGGFRGFEIIYSDMKENVSVIIRAQTGAIFLFPRPKKFNWPDEGALSVSRGGDAGKDVTLSGNSVEINSALQSIQYLGNDNFYGDDEIFVHSVNKNGMEEAAIPIFVEPVNDPPTIYAPKFIYLTLKQRSNRMQVYNRQRDIYDFSIMDVDLYNFPGNKSDFTVLFSMEVNNGALSATLPVKVVTSAELKVKNGHQWQPLQTFVMISNFFVLEGQGIRFRGTIEDCNHAIQLLYYQASDRDAVLTIGVNDMGNHGCYSDCKQMVSLPFYSEVKVNLVRRRPFSPKIALLLGSAIVIEIVVLILLGGVLLFFICKCMNALQGESREGSIHNTQLSAKELNYQSVGSDLSR